MSNQEQTAAVPPGWARSLTAALGAAVTCGVLFGFWDAVLADVHLHPPTGLVGIIGCYSAAIMSYCLLFALLLVPLGLLVHPLQQSTSPVLRFRRLLTAGLAFGLFAEIYWWTRPYIYPGLSSVSLIRLSAAAGLAVLALLLAFGLVRVLLAMPRKFHLGLRAIALVSIVLGLLFVRSEAQLVGSRGVLNERNRDLPNVLLIIVDALRADHLGCYGNDRIKTPHIDALAAGGVLFESCFAQAPYTLTSFGSILTGKYPRRHGLVAQIPGVQMKPNITLPIHLKTAFLRDSTEHLRDEDYASGVFMTGAVSHGSGLANGFDAYSEAMMGHDLVQTDSQWSVFRSELLLWMFKNKLKQRVDSSLVVTTARGWLRRQEGRRWVAMVHLYSTHTPYDPPTDFKDPYLDPTYSGPFSSFYAAHREAFEQGQYDPNEADVARIRDLYAAGTAQADAQIGELIAELKELGMYDDTLIILTSDHGEDLGEWRAVGAVGKSTQARIWEHNHMWQTNLRIPMILTNTRLLPHGVRIGELTESVDLLPTICDLLDLDVPRDEAIDGQSLGPLIAGVQRGEASEFQPKLYTYSENNLFFSIQDQRFKLIVPRKLLSKSVLEEEGDEALFSGEYWVRFYALEEDTDEAENVLAPENTEVLRLWEALKVYDASMPIAEFTVRTDRDLEQEALLNALGYAGGINPEAIEEDDGARPDSAPDPDRDSE